MFKTTTAIALLSALALQPAIAAVDTSEYGEWQDILTPVQAQGRFQWLEKCFSGFLVETHDKMYGPTLLSDAEKVDVLEKLWLYNGNDAKAEPRYLTFGDANHQNPQNWYAGTSASESCRTIPSSYQATGLITSFNFAQYCDNKAFTSEYSHIAGVKVGEQISTSGANEYSNFWGRVVKMTRNTQTSFELTPGYGNSAIPTTWRIWIDWNGDGDFLDADERIHRAQYKTTAVTGQFNIPSHAKAGLTKMRISMDIGGGNDDACVATQYGEVEDYTVRVL